MYTGYRYKSYASYRSLNPSFISARHPLRRIGFIEGLVISGLDMYTPYSKSVKKVNADDVLKESLTMGVPSIDGSGFSKETVRIEYEWNVTLLQSSGSET
ncbi:hypothetical protein Tco_1550628, partial [Tanacetum coccineum]